MFDLISIFYEVSALYIVNIALYNSTAYSVEAFTV